MRKEVTIVKGLSRDRAAEYVWEDIFKMWNAWFWLLLDGGGGVGKTTILKTFETKAIGLSNGDFFRALNLFLTEKNLTEKSAHEIYTKLPFLSITAQLLDGEKMIVVKYKDNEQYILDPSGQGPDGLRNPDLEREFTDFLSADLTVVSWWQQQIKSTLKVAWEKSIPVVAEGRTNIHFRATTEKDFWQGPLKDAVIGYLYISKLELVRRSQSRAEKNYIKLPAEKRAAISLHDFVRKAVVDDWERTVLEMSRSEERLLRPSEARDEVGSGYDFAYNISQLSTREVTSLIAATLMYNLNRQSDESELYTQIYYELLKKFEVNLDKDPHLATIEGDIQDEMESLIKRRKLKRPKKNAA